ncbi:MAG: hypothetical protein ACREUT_04045 [Steroidobacteraceae bacterium]
MNTKHEELTAGERRYLEHVRRAQSQGMGLSAYCRSIGLNPFALYSMRRQLRRKGVLGPAGSQEAPRVRRGSALVAVRIAEPATSTVAVAPAGMVCRMRAPSGWVIECGAWPEAGWLAECMGGGEHAAR